MANVYVYSGGDNSDGSTWAKAYTTLNGAMTGAAVAGNDYWAASDHVESTAGAITHTSPGTVAAPCRVVSVNRAGSTPPVAADVLAGASVATTGAAAINFLGNVSVCYGVTFSAGSVANAANILHSTTTSCSWNYDTCAFILNSTNAANKLLMGTATATATSLCTWRDCTVKFGATGQGFLVKSGQFYWKGGSVDAAGSAPTTLFLDTTPGGTSIVLLEGVDLSHLGSGKTIFGAKTINGEWTIKDCKLGSSVTPLTTPTARANSYVIRSASSGLNYTHAKYNFEGSLDQEITVVRTGGATDGTTPIAWKISTTANCKPMNPFICPPISIWNTSTSSMTVTMYGISDGGAVPNKDDIWMEIEYLGTASFPLGNFTSTFPATILTVGTATTSDTSTWGGSTSKFKLVSSSFTPAFAGPFTIRIKVGAASVANYYVDPAPEISGVTLGKAYMGVAGTYVTEISGSSSSTKFIIGG